MLLSPAINASQTVCGAEKSSRPKSTRVGARRFSSDRRTSARDGTTWLRRSKALTPKGCP